MAVYSFFVLGESNVSVTGTRVVNGNTVNKTLDGIDQGDGSHLDGEFLTINSKNATEVFVDDDGTETLFADNDSGQELASDVTLDGVLYTAGTRIEAEYQFVVVDDNTGIQYTAITVNIANSNPVFGTVEAIAFIGDVPPADVALRVISTNEGPPNSGPNAFDESEIVACFCAGTRIATDLGEIAVEALTPGTRVLRPDGTLATLRCVFQTVLEPEALTERPNFYPVRIMAGALGRSLPVRDLWVSRQHRMVMSSKIAERMFAAQDVLIAAIRLTEMPGIFVDETRTSVTYFHLLFDRHEVILAEGAPTESLFTGPEALKAVPDEARTELLSLFPDIASQTHCPAPARIIPARKQQKHAVARHLKNDQPILS